jgi:hypothetical protein
LFKRFHCQEFYYPYIGFTNETCPTLFDSLNASNYRQTYYDEPENDMLCSKSCRDECEYLNYDTVVSNSLFPSSKYSQVIIANENISKNFDDTKNDDNIDDSMTSSSSSSMPNYDTIKSGVLAASVYYSAEMYNRIREKPSTEFEVFVSNLGGNLGLFLGISLLSFIELIEVFYEWLCSITVKKSKIVPNSNSSMRKLFLK